MKISFDLEKLGKVSEQADKILIDPKAEAELIKLVDARDRIEELYQEAKRKITESALKLNPNFKSVHGDRIVCSYAFSGARYGIEPGLEDQVPVELVEKKIRYYPNVKALEEWEKQYNKLPYGVTVNIRKKVLRIKINGEEDDTEA